MCCQEFHAGAFNPKLEGIFAARAAIFTCQISTGSFLQPRELVGDKTECGFVELLHVDIEVKSYQVLYVLV